MSKKIRFLSLFLSAAMVVSSLCACATTTESSSSSADESDTSSESAEDVDPNVDGDVILNAPGEFPL
ncbi:MAG: hypothetical protein R3Y33_08395, partial [Clostridia bacterium]